MITSRTAGSPRLSARSSSGPIRAGSSIRTPWTPKPRAIAAKSNDGAKSIAGEGGAAPAPRLAAEPLVDLHVELQDPVRGVVADHVDDGDPRRRGGPEPLHRHHRAA